MMVELLKQEGTFSSDLLKICEMTKANWTA